ncbi:MAG: TatD family hydrolase [Myxococcota bacterium]
MTSLVDIGVNLTHRSFSPDLAEVLERSRKAKVEQLVITGTSLDASKDGLQLAELRRDMLHATTGVHPHDAKSWNDASLPTLETLAQHELAVAVGECGLDYHRDFSPRDAQRRCFEAQLELAVGLDLPVFLHERAAHEDFLATLKRYRPRLRAAVVHCFTGSSRELDAYLDLDLHIGITGWICDDRRGAHLRPLMPKVGADRLMIETDAPFLKPRVRGLGKGRRNEPAFLPYVLAEVATAKGQPAEQLAAETTATAREFFQLHPLEDATR